MSMANVAVMMRQVRRVSAAPAPAPGAPAWMSGMPLNTWTAISNTNIATAQTYSAPLARNKANVLAYSGMAVKLSGSELLIAGGGHTDYPGNEVLSIRLADDTPAWTVRIAPSADGNIVAGSRYFTDGRPNSRHTYWELHHTTHNNRLMFIGAGSIWENGGASGWVDGFNLTNNTYDGSGTYTDIPGGLPHLPDVGQCIDSNGTIWHYLYSGGTLHKYVPSTDTWTSYGATNANGPMALAHDSTRNRLVNFSGTWGSYIDNLSGTPAFNAVTFGGANAAEADSCNVVYVPDLDVFLIKPWETNSIYQCHPTTFAITPYSVSGTPPGTPASDGKEDHGYGRFNICPELKIVVWVQSTTHNVYAFKYA